MPVPASINDLSTTAGSNSPPGSESPATIDDYLRAHASFIAQLRDGKLDDSAVSAFMLTVLDDADGPSARATLGANNATNLTTGTLADARLSSSGPTAPTIANSYSDAGGTRYWKIAGMVVAAIDVTRASPPGDVNIFTLPSGFRPGVELYPVGIYAVGITVGLTQFTVTTAGGVRATALVGAPGSGATVVKGVIVFQAA